MVLLLLFSFLAGLVTALSPCTLPILPVLLSAGANTSRTRPLGIVFGLILSFTFFTLFLTALVKVTGISPDFLRYAAIALIFLFGLVMLVPALSDWFARATARIAAVGEAGQEQSQKWGRGWIGGLILGGCLGLLWTPCAGPILGAIATLAATQAFSWQLFFLILSYSLGASLPMLLIIYGGQAILTSSRWLSTHTESIRKAFGLLMILTALAMANGVDLTFQGWASKFVPSLVIEEHPIVTEQLSRLRQEKSLTPLGNAPELAGITSWINTEPLTIEGLRGKVVLVDFWTYSCINCIRTLPYHQQWVDRYRDRGFVLIGVHTPEFEFEKKHENVAKAVERFAITYPVALDNDYKTWQAYHNAYWPAHYLIDQEGIIREVQFGEGHYVETENTIRALLGLAPIMKEEPKPEIRLGQTPETYLGYERAQQYVPDVEIKRDVTETFASETTPGPDQVALRGSWHIGPESITSQGDESVLVLNFQATHVYVVMDGKSETPVQVLLDGKLLPKENYTVDMNADGQILVDQPRKYDLIDLKGSFGRHQLRLIIPKGISAYAFTFGS
ncbi:MAG: cytochrome c biogenesis protein DipZ [Parachlamydia sp.]|nr:cytochrome c biogenesis protein DipZ [Parachlamydia sp.]